MTELKWIAAKTDTYAWANRNPGNHEFTGDRTTQVVFSPISLDQAGNVIADSSGRFAPER